VDDLNSECESQAKEALILLTIRLGTKPYATLTLTAACIIYYWIVGSPCGYYRCFGDPMLVWLLHPLIHDSIGHLIGNIFFGVLIVGSLIEVWMTQITVFGRYILLFLGYPIGLLISYATWYSLEFPAFGASALVSAWLAFCIAYYWKYHRYVRTRTRRDALAPFGIGFVTAYFVAPFVTGNVWGYVSEIGSPTLHLAAFLMASAIAYLFLFRRRVFAIKKNKK
jgi:membrane associated rhomboid family serine protease